MPPPLKHKRIASEQYHRHFTTWITHVDSVPRHACVQTGCKTLTAARIEAVKYFDNPRAIRNTSVCADKSLVFAADKVGKKSRRGKMGQARQAHTPYDEAQK
jgi:hypothetical protein